MPARGRYSGGKKYKRKNPTNPWTHPRTDPPSPVQQKYNSSPRTHKVCTIIVQQQQFSRKKRGTMPETGEGIADENKKQKITAVRRTMPERGRYGDFGLSTPLHAPRSPSTYTADVYSSTYISYLVQQDMRWYRVSSCVVQGWMYSSTCVGTFGRVQGFPFCTILRHPGQRAIRPRDGLSTPPARRASVVALDVDAHGAVGFR